MGDNGFLQMTCSFRANKVVGELEILQANL